MSEELESSRPDDSDWPRNYFNYFTEIEDHFQRARGTALFLLSPLDWALIENWKSSGIPLEAVFKGIDEAFEKWRSRKSKRRMINSLAYCSQAVLEAAQRVASTGTSVIPTATAPFATEEIRQYLRNGALSLQQKAEPAFHEIAATLNSVACGDESQFRDLEELERRLTAMEDKIVAILRASESDEVLIEIRRALDQELKAYRGRMTADQLAMLERRYLDTALLERAKLPRLSLFYLR